MHKYFVELGSQTNSKLAKNQEYRSGRGGAEQHAKSCLPVDVSPEQDEVTQGWDDKAQTGTS